MHRKKYSNFQFAIPPKPSKPKALLDNNTFNRTGPQKYIPL